MYMWQQSHVFIINKLSFIYGPSIIASTEWMSLYWAFYVLPSVTCLIIKSTFIESIALLTSLICTVGCLPNYCSLKVSHFKVYGHHPVTWYMSGKRSEKHDEMRRVTEEAMMSKQFSEWATSTANRRLFHHS